MQWLRLYTETLNDPKIQRLPDASFKAWFNALCLAGMIESSDGKIGTRAAVAFAFRVTEEAVSSAFHELIKEGLIVTVGETFQIVKWSKRQYKSDSSSERVKRHRKRIRNVTVTAPEQSRTDTDTEQRERNPLTPSSGGNFNEKIGDKNGRSTKPRSGAEAAERIADKISRGENLG